MDNLKHSGFLFSITLIATLGGLLFGYDTAVISGAIGPVKTYFKLNNTEMGWAASSALIGCIIGALIAFPSSLQLGRKRSLLLAAILFLVSAIGTAFPDSFTEFIIYRIIGGAGVGIASMLSPMYIAEIAPPEKRGHLVSWNQFSLISGMLVVYFVNYFISLQGDEIWNTTTGWRWMFGSEAIPAVLFFILLFFVPESPRWLVLKNKEAKAYDVLSKINGKHTASAILENIKLSLKKKKGKPSDLLKPGLKMALVIGILLSVFQQVTGINVFLYYAPEIFKGFGSSSNSALLQTVLVGAVNLLFTIIAIYTVDRYGRKPLLAIGAAGMAFCITMIGFGAYFQNMGGWLLPFVLGYIASFALSWGPVVWVMLSEIFPNSVRSIAMSVAVAAQWIFNFLVSQTFPMLNGNEYLVNMFHGAFPFWLYGFMGILAVIFIWRMVPETKKKSLEDLETLWHTDENEKKKLVPNDAEETITAGL